MGTICCDRNSIRSDIYHKRECENRLSLLFNLPLLLNKRQWLHRLCS
ncbi:hypothetical protein CsSME_00039431 [Camellia sinensis var. sinensis]